MQNLPSFFVLLKQNVLLWTIITTHSFAHADFKNTQHVLRNPHFLILSHYAMSEHDKFDEVWIRVSDMGTSVSFMTSDPKYLKYAKNFFGSEEPSGELQGSYMLNNKRVATSSKMYGPFNLGTDNPVFVTVSQTGPQTYKLLMDFNTKKHTAFVKKLRDSIKQADSLNKIKQ